MRPSSGDAVERCGGGADQHDLGFAEQGAGGAARREGGLGQVERAAGIEHRRGLPARDVDADIAVRDVDQRVGQPGERLVDAALEQVGIGLGTADEPLVGPEALPRRPRPAARRSVPLCPRRFGRLGPARGRRGALPKRWPFIRSRPPSTRASAMERPQLALQ
jgi:hypothetical protein